MVSGEEFGRWSHQEVVWSCFRFAKIVHLLHLDLFGAYWTVSELAANHILYIVCELF